MDYGRLMKPLFNEIPFGLGQTNFGAFGVFLVKLAAPILVQCTVSPLSMFSNIQPLFLQKTRLLYPHPKCLFWIGIQIRAAKNLGFIPCVHLILNAHFEIQILHGH